MSALAEIREAPGLDAYLGDLEERLEHAVGAYRGVVAEVGAEALAAGGKRLRPLLVYLSAPPGSEPPVVAGVAVELVHLATLMHDDLIDGARLHAGTHRPGRRMVPTPRARRATISLPAPSPSSPRRATRRRWQCSPTPRSALRGVKRCSARSASILTRASRRISNVARSRRGSCSRRRAA